MNIAITMLATVLSGVCAEPYIFAAHINRESVPVTLNVMATPFPTNQVWFFEYSADLTNWTRIGDGVYLDGTNAGVRFTSTAATNEFTVIRLRKLP